MQNPHKGEVELKAGDRTFVLRYSIDAICSLEGRLDKGVGVILMGMADPSKVRVTVAREVLFAGLQERHPEITLQEAGELMIAAGGITKVMEKITEAFKMAFPDVEADKHGRPPTGPRQDGTGRPSSKDGSAKSHQTRMRSGARLPAN